VGNPIADPFYVCARRRCRGAALGSRFSAGDDAANLAGDGRLRARLSLLIRCDAPFPRAIGAHDCP
jgi:hypothetical protein